MLGTISLIFLGFILLIVVISKIPGLEHLVKPIIDIVFSLIKILSENGFAWIIFMIKGLWSAHVEYFEHMIKEPKDIDPTAEIRDSLD